MFVLATLVETGALSIAAILFLLACTLLALGGTHVVRRNQKQEIRRWLSERKAAENKGND